MPNEGVVRGDTDGVAYGNDDGTLRADSAEKECCCGCTTCDDISDISLVLSAITLCACVDGGGYYLKLITNFNGTYTGFTALPSDATYNCVFSKDVAQENRMYAASDCSGSSEGTSTTNATIFVRHRIADDKWEFIIEVVDDALALWWGFAAVGTSADPSFTLSAVDADEDSDCGPYDGSDAALLAVGLSVLTTGGHAHLEFICA